MECPQCHTPLPDVAHYCHRCGKDVISSTDSRQQHFAVKPDEPVASFAIVSTIMPRGAGQRGQTYRIALVIALVIALLAACFGAVPLAVLVAAFAIPVVYIVYLYDVNLWDDNPVQVTVMAFVLTFVLGLGFTALWFLGIGTGSADGSGAGEAASSSSVDVSGLLVAALLVPIVGELIRQIGPVFLASRPRFDDLLDGASFGVISGVAFATADTLVRHWPLLVGGFTREVDPGLWMSLIFLEGFVKPLLIGTASGIACAEFSGLGRGYDGFSPRYVRGVVEAILANVLYFGGIHLFSNLEDATLSVVVSIIWGLLILGVLVIRMRRILHVALLEAALESAQAEVAGAPVPQAEQEFCSQCEMPMILGSSFCSACGASARARGKVHSHAGAPLAGPPAPAASGPGDPPAPAGPGSAGGGTVTSTEGEQK
ncbi:zinc-ribbon domain-containing protein [Pseudactinotalea suaedae]|uniref:zinc-ribbon domain-containing protein n=1 Tax=Pseudactinotalea suaedae TaxID=1524924 RepID=UPI0012E0DB83|nr:zinc-ribbon domain-containing protein [Pseudactinotalea suaedae]